MRGAEAQVCSCNFKYIALHLVYTHFDLCFDQDERGGGGSTLVEVGALKFLQTFRQYAHKDLHGQVCA
jgi:hypothetical protein